MLAVPTDRGHPSWEETSGNTRSGKPPPTCTYHDDAATLSNPQPQTDHYLAADVDFAAVLALSVVLAGLCLLSLARISRAR